MVLEQKVTEVIDGDTFKIEIGWKWGGETGNIIRPTGYNTPEKGEAGYKEAKDKLTGLILGKIVKINEAKTIDHGRLVCPVIFNGKNLADYFPEYKC